ncbi:MAG: acyltransferase family protein [Clostridia bacterium]|nr:acyltransferase family protein [Clostridia bacterium]
MSIVLITVLIILFYKSKLAKNGFYRDECLSVATTTSIKGFFVLLILISHLGLFVKFNSLIDKPWILFIWQLGQLIVTVFLFYGGYGIMESIKKKGDAYIKQIPVRRFFRVLFEFDLAVLLYLAFQNYIGTSYSGEIDYSVGNVIKAFFAIGNLGNPAWFILCVLVHYLIAYASFRIFKDFRYALFAVGILSVAYMIVCSILLPVSDGRFYNTSICFFCGMVLSFYKEKILTIYTKHYKKVIGLIIVAAGGRLLWYFAKGTLSSTVIVAYIDNLLYFPIYSILFVFLILGVSLKVKFGNEVLDYLGNHVFSIYILQLLPMYILRYLKIDEYNVYVFAFLAIIFALILAHFFEKLVAYLWNKLTNI